MRAGGCREAGTLHVTRAIEAETHLGGDVQPARGARGRRRRRGGAAARPARAERARRPGRLRSRPPTRRRTSPSSISAGGRVVRRIRTLEGPRSIQAAPGGVAIVANTAAHAITIIDARARRVVRVLRGFDEPRYTAVAPDGRHALRDRLGQRRGRRRRPAPRARRGACVRGRARPPRDDRPRGPAAVGRARLVGRAPVDHRRRRPAAPAPDRRSCGRRSSLTTSASRRAGASSG